MDFGNNFNGFWHNGLGALPYRALSPFFLNQLHNYPNINPKQDSLMQRQMLMEPDLKFGNDNSSHLDDSLTEGILPDKSKSLKALVEIINEEIDERLKIKDGILSRMEDDIVRCDNYLLEVKSIGIPYYFIASRRRTSIEHEIFALEREKRMEETACWRDLVFLKKDLFAALKEYWAAVNREKLLSGDDYSEQLEVIEYGS